MVDRQYGQISVRMGDGPDQVATLTAIVDRARLLAAAGHHREAYELILDAVQQVEQVGRPDVALQLLADLRGTVPESLLAPADHAWLLNSEGLALGALGRWEDAAAAFERMQALGIQLNDREIISTALQNQGSLAFHTGQLEEARLRFEESLRAKAEFGDTYAAAQLTLNLAAVAVSRGEQDEAHRLLVEAEELVKRARDPHLLSTLYLGRGNLAVHRGELAEAEQSFRRGLRHARRSGDLVVQAQALMNLGSVHADQKRAGSALGWYKRALRLADALELPPLLESINRGLAVVLHQAGRDLEAVSYLERSREIAQQLGARHAWASATADLGALSLTLGQIDRAVALLNQALEAFRRLGDAEWEVRVLRNLAEAQRAAGDSEAAIEAVESALRLLAPDAHAERADLLRRAAEGALSRRDSRHLAAIYFERSLDALQQAGEPRTLAWQAVVAGAALAESGDPKAALPFYGRALALYERGDDEQMAFHARNDRAIALTNLGRYEEARRDYVTCLALATRLNDRAMELQATMNLGEMARREGRAEEARGLLERAIDLARVLEDRRSEAEALGSLGIALHDASYSEQARAAFELARDVAHRIRDAGSEATALGGLAGLEFAVGRHAEALTLYRRAAELRSRTGTGVHLVEDLGGVIECLAALGRADEIEEQAQRLVDVAQEIRATDLGCEALARTARWWLKRGQVDEAASLYAAAIALAAAGATDDTSDLLGAIAKALMLLVIHVRIESESDEDAVYERILGVLNEQYEGLGDQLRDMLRAARESAPPLGPEDRL